MNQQKPNEWLYLGIACIAAIVVMLPIPFFGIPSGTDLPQHFQFAQTYYDSLTTGDGFPSWSDRENFGYGGIGIRFYPPFAYYVLAFARILAGNWFDATWLTFTFWMVAGCLGVYFWARWWFPAKESAIAAIFYAIVPYHLNQLYNSFIYADFAGAAVLPFCLAFLARVLGREKKSDILGLAVTYAVLVLTHIPTTIIGSLCLGVFTLLLLQKGNRFRQIFKASVGVILGLAASSFYWFRMVSEMSWLNHATDRFSDGHYAFYNRFFPTYFSAREIDYKPGYVLFDLMLVLTLLFLASAVIYLFYRKRIETDRITETFLTVLPLGLFGFFMATPLSYPLWKILSPLQKVQFPWRWMSVVAMCGAVVASAAVHYLLKGDFLKQRVWSYSFFISISTVLFFNIVSVWHPVAFVPITRADFENQLRELPDEQSFFCWWSVWSNLNALNTKERVLTENRETLITDWRAEERSFTAATGVATKARIATFYYPRWKATVNDQPVNIEQDENGVMLVPLPAEKSTVKIFFQESLGIRIASIFSVIAWLFIITAFLFLLSKKFALIKIPRLHFVE